MKKRQKILARLIVGVAAITIGIGMWNADLAKQNTNERADEGVEGR